MGFKAGDLVSITAGPGHHPVQYGNFMYYDDFGNLMKAEGGEPPVNIKPLAVAKDETGKILDIPVYEVITQ